MKYFTGFLPLYRAKFHLFESKFGKISICGQRKAVSSGHATLEKTNNKFHLRTPVHKEDLEFNHSSFCKKCINKI